MSLFRAPFRSLANFPLSEWRETQCQLPSRLFGVRHFNIIHDRNVDVARAPGKLRGRRFASHGRPPVPLEAFSRTPMVIPASP